MRKSLSYVGIFAVLVVAPVTLAAAATSQIEQPPAPIDQPVGFAEALHRASPEQRDSYLRSLGPEHRESAQNFLDDVDRDRIGVVDQKGELRGYITRAANDAPPADSWDDDFPVVDADGREVGRWYGGLGFVEQTDVRIDLPFPALTAR